MEKSPMKMTYSGKGKLAGLPAINSKGKSETAPKMKATASAGKMYKAPAGGSTRLGRKADDKSSGSVAMMPQSKSDKTRYTQAKQPIQFSNEGPKATRFVC